MQRFQNAVRAFISDDGGRFGTQRFKRLPPRMAFGRQKSNKTKLIDSQSRRRQRRQYRRSSWQRNHCQARVDGGHHHAIAGIRNQRRAGVGDNRDGIARAQTFHNFGRAAGLVMLVIAQQWLANFEMIQQFLRLARVLAGDGAHLFAQHAQRPQRDVLQISYGSCHEIENACQTL